MAVDPDVLATNPVRSEHRPMNMRSLHGRGEPTGVEQVLLRCRARLDRLSASQAFAAQTAGGLLIDTRTDVQRAETGHIPGALVIDRTVLEWRLDPRSETAISEMVNYDVQVIVICRHGFSSSIAAASLLDVGLRRVADVIGGVEGWIAAGLPLRLDSPM